MRWSFAFLPTAVIASAAFAGPISSLALAKPFDARSPWRFSVSQGPAAEDFGGNAAPGVIKLCLSKDRGVTCQHDLQGALRLHGGPDLFSTAHYLENARIVRSRNGPLLLVQMSSLHSGDGDQRVATIALAYDRAHDRFVTAYEKRTNRNNNQEVRYIEAGPLQGDIVSAEPTGDAPYAFWITVNTPAGSRYRQALRYRSATRYGDGNPLAVIDSETPGIERRLGLWRAGQPLPLPAKGCVKPRLAHGELWCS